MSKPTPARFRMTWIDPADSAALTLLISMSLRWWITGKASWRKEHFIDTARLQADADGDAILRKVAADCPGPLTAAFTAFGRAWGRALA